MKAVLHEWGLPCVSSSLILLFVVRLGLSGLGRCSSLQHREAGLPPAQPARQALGGVLHPLLQPARSDRGPPAPRTHLLNLSLDALMAVWSTSRLVSTAHLIPAYTASNKCIVSPDRAWLSCARWVSGGSAEAGCPCAASGACITCTSRGRLLFTTTTTRTCTCLYTMLDSAFAIVDAAR